MLLGDSSDSSKGMNHLIMVEDHPKVRGVETVKLEKTTICSALCFGVLNKKRMTPLEKFSDTLIEGYLHRD